MGRNPDVLQDDLSQSGDQTARSGEIGNYLKRPRGWIGVDFTLKLVRIRLVRGSGLEIKNPSAPTAQDQVHLTAERRIDGRDPSISSEPKRHVLISDSDQDFFSGL